VKRPPPRRWKSSRFGNALLGWELLRVSRRIGTLAVGRFAFGAALLGILWLLWSAGFSQTQMTSGDATAISKLLQKFAEAFSLTFFIVQLGLVLLLTPIFVAGSVFEERDTRSGEVLLTTDLTRREVFYGKLLARMVQVMMVVAAGMPILALTLLWGGVAIQFIILGYVATFLCIFSSGAIAASVSGSSESLREAVLKSYAYTLVFDGLIFPASPFLLIVVARNEVGGGLCLAAIFLPVQLIVIFVALAHALRWLRLAMLRQRRRVTTELQTEMARRRPPLPEEDPLLWKERHVGAMSETTSTVIFAGSFVCVVGTLIVVLLGAGTLPSGWVAAYLTPFVLALAATSIGLGAAGGVARERQRNTLIDLFMIPGGRREILRAKLLGSLWNSRWLAAAVACLIIVSFISGTPLLALPLLIVAAAVYLAFAAGLGVWVSVRCRTARNANSTWMGFVALSLIGTYLLADASSERVRQANSNVYVQEYPAWSRVVNPLMAWEELAMTPDDAPIGWNGSRPWHPRIVPDETPRVWPSLLGLVLHGVAAGLLWYFALRRFEREGREE
jgi:ABC-type transport system involved in multi-copper enzyme maturation permease subunit